MVAKKRILASIAAISALAMGLAGCGSGGGNSSADSKKGEKVTLTYMHRLPDSKGMTQVNDIVKKWNEKNPNIQVKATKFDGKSAEMIKKLETDVKADNGPDLAQLGYAEVPEVFTKGLLQDVTSEAKKYEGNFAKGPFNLMQVNGKYYGLPQDTGPMLYFYNKAELDKLGITELPKTADELVADSQKTAAAGKYMMTLQADGNWLSGMAGASGPWYKVEDGKWVVNTDTKGSQATADTFQKLVDAKAALYIDRWSPTFDSDIQNNTIIGTVGGAWEAPLIMGSAGEHGVGDWRMAQMGDWFGNGTKTGPNGGSGVAVLKGSKHPAEAMKFLNWFNTQVADLTSQGLIVAATTEKAKTPDTWSKFYGGEDLMKEFATANDNMSSFTYIPGFSAVNSDIVEKTAKVPDGSVKMKDVFTSAQKTSIDTLKNYNLPVKE
ncbi:extracellular solute-binding protein [Bifidobacterium sp. ESL0728]|uniref:ABC transporter substrate-binding protein n=1 Tax=Bifidobacterium sp. ESL0728 TaxID=2983220 RepID=UPI0023F9143D|nr:extracellular solute-binding protein [Bifidobacterium sp. ESL0728]WEV58782.1 extracellular solute-binding protein [Bifidobacterium sp. ESL0728]